MDTLRSRVRFRSRVGAIALAASAVVAIAATASQALDVEPFQRLGKQLVELADKTAGANASTSNATSLRLAPIHDRLLLGAFELWAPLKLADAKGKVRDGVKPKDLQSRAAALLRLQEHWLARAGADGDRLETTRDATVKLREWFDSLRSFPHAPRGASVEQANDVLGQLFGQPMRSGNRLTLIHAPTRAQYIGVLGARGVLDESRQKDLWTLVNARAPYAALLDGATVSATTWSPVDEHAALMDELPMQPAESAEWFAHVAAHKLAYWLAPTSPTWFLEALAIDSTIAVCGADETVCTGCRELDEAPMWLLEDSPLGYVTRDRSPYRGTSAKRFLKPLRAALKPEGFVILDLETEKPGPIVGELLLGERTEIPAEVRAGPEGVRKGYAEFYRAYCAAFVHYLETEHPGALALLIRKLREVPVERRLDHSPLHRTVAKELGRTLGQNTDPSKDFEAAFRAWLR